jgi:hypothetical protein
MILAANVALMNRYSGFGTAPNYGTSAPIVPAPVQLPSQTQLFDELLNEPDYKCSGTYAVGCTPTTAYQDPALWNQAMIDIAAAVRGIGDTTHWFIVGGPSSSKAQNFPAMKTMAEAKVIYDFHKYDPIAITNQSAGFSINPLLLYPRESSCIGPGGACPGSGPSFAVGWSSSNQVPSVLGSAPTIGNTNWNTTVTTALLTGCTSPLTWNAGQALTANGKIACVKPGGSGASANFNYFTSPSSNSNAEVTIDDLFSNTATGIEYATCWAAATQTPECAAFANGVIAHTGGQAGVPVFLMAGEIGMITDSCDYRSCRQLLADLRSTMMSTPVIGGQAIIPPTLWALDGVKFGVRPKSQGAMLKDINGNSYNDFCLYGYGQLASYGSSPSDPAPLFGYDADMWARMQSTPAAPPLMCSGSQYGTPGY